MADETPAAGSPDPPSAEPATGPAPQEQITNPWLDAPGKSLEAGHVTRFPGNAEPTSALERPALTNLPSPVGPGDTPPSRDGREPIVDPGFAQRQGGAQRGNGATTPEQARAAEDARVAAAREAAQDLAPGSLQSTFAPPLTPEQARTAADARLEAAREAARRLAPGSLQASEAQRRGGRDASGQRPTPSEELMALARGGRDTGPNAADQIAAAQQQSRLAEPHVEADKGRWSPLDVKGRGPSEPSGTEAATNSAGDAAMREAMARMAGNTRGPKQSAPSAQPAKSTGQAPSQSNPIRRAVGRVLRKSKRL